MKLARLLVVHSACLKVDSHIQRSLGRGYSQEVAQAQAGGYVECIQSAMMRFMVLGQLEQPLPAPIHWIYHTRTYGMKVRYTTAVAGAVQWERHSVLYRQLSFSMDQLRSMVHGLVSEAGQLLFQQLLLMPVAADSGEADLTQLPQLHLDSMRDQPSQSQVGWSFLKDTRSRFDVEGEWWLFQRIYEQPALGKQFLKAGGTSTRARASARASARSSAGSQEPTLNPKAVLQYERCIERFLELLLLCMHLSGGQPARTPEILGLRWRNTAQGGTRNIFIEDGLVAFVASYHKGFQHSGNVKVIHRYLPREVGELLVYYIWLVLPFKSKLRLQLYGKNEESAFLWGDGRPQRPQRWTGPLQRSQEQQQQPPNSQPELECGYQQRQWTGDRLRRILEEASARYMGGTKLNISSWRQISIAISRRFCQEHRFQSQGEAGEASGSDSEIEDSSP